MSIEIDITKILEMIPHRYPILLVDRIIDFVEGESITGLKNVTFNEPHFMGHFPSKPIMPGVLIIESMAQTGGVLLLNSFPNPEEKLVLFMQINNAKFRKPVYPGDQLKLEVEAIKFRSKTGQCRGRALVGDKVVCEADEVKFALVDRRR